MAVCRCRFRAPRADRKPDLTALPSRNRRRPRRLDIHPYSTPRQSQISLVSSRESRRLQLVLDSRRHDWAGKGYYRG